MDNERILIKIEELMELRNDPVQAFQNERNQAVYSDYDVK